MRTDLLKQLNKWRAHMFSCSNECQRALALIPLTRMAFFCTVGTIGRGPHVTTVTGKYRFSFNTTSKRTIPICGRSGWPHHLSLFLIYKSPVFCYISDFPQTVQRGELRITSCRRVRRMGSPQLPSFLYFYVDRATRITSYERRIRTIVSGN